MNRIATILAAISFCLIGGCASHNGTLTMTSLDQKHIYAQTFTHAYYNADGKGQADVVLVDEGPTPPDNDPTHPLTPIPTLAPHQIVHIRILWLPLLSKADHPAGANASLNWCIIGPNPNDTDLLEYGGSGLVRFDDSGSNANLTIHTAWMKPVQQRGNMTDPLGPSTLEGQIKATRNPAQVKALIAEIKSATNDTDTQAAP